MAQWIEWAKRIQAMAQNGAAYTQKVYDLERYHLLHDIAHQMMARENIDMNDNLPAYFD